jgi:hypothetical protein
MMEHHDLEQIACGVLLKVGALKSCAVGHGELYEGSGDVEAAYRAANAMVTNGEIDLMGRTRREFTDIIKNRWRCMNSGRVAGIARRIWLTDYPPRSINWSGEAAMGRPSTRRDKERTNRWFKHRADMARLYVESRTQGSLGAFAT